MYLYLLDTNFVLFWLIEPERIPTAVRAQVDTGAVYIRVVSYWEVVLKSTKAKLNVGDPETWWNLSIDRFAATVLPLRAAHLSEIRRLPPIHQDPFDRGLIAQAITEGLIFPRSIWFSLSTLLLA